MYHRATCRLTIILDLVSYLSLDHKSESISRFSKGSDVANISCSAAREGEYYVVNGNKKYITNGTFADYFVVAVRTGEEGSGAGGLSFVLMERGMAGFEIRKMKIGGKSQSMSGTAYLDFTDVKVAL